MVTEQQIVSSIKRKHLFRIIWFILAMLLLPSMFALPFMNNGANEVPLEMVIIVVFIGTIFTIIVDGYILKKHLIPEIKDHKDILRDPVFRAFKSPSDIVRILNEIESSEKVYEQGNIKMTEEYIVDMWDYRTIVRFADVTSAAVGVDPHNTDGEALFVTDKYNRTCHYSITGDKNAAKHLGDLVYKRCPNLHNKFEQPSDAAKL